MNAPFPGTLSEFQVTFPDDKACRQYLVESRWPDGFRCPGCGGEAAWQRSGARFLCRRCRRETSVTAGTVLDHTRLGLVTWFQAAYLVATEPGLNALSLGRQLGLSSRETTNAVMNRLRRSMSSLALPPLSGIVEAGEAVVGRDTAGTRGFNVAGTNTLIVLVAVERANSRTRLVVIPDRNAATVGPLLGRLVAPGSIVVRATPAADGAISRFRRWLLATYHKPPADHRPYLDEFCFRAEFQADPAAAFATMLGLAVRSHDHGRAQTAAGPHAMTSATIPKPPSREERIAARRAMLAFSARRQRPGSGSMLDQLMQGERPTMDWWGKAAGTLKAEKIKIAVTGGVAANAYMPPRHTADLDLAVHVADLDQAGRALEAAGWAFLGDLSLYEDLRGTAWQLGHHELDVIGLPGAWGRAAIAAAQDNRRVSGLATLTLPYIVVMKLISARPQDSADISRMLGPASEQALESVRALVSRERPDDVKDLEQMIVAGRLEFGHTERL
jgi:transposase-like protein